MFVAPDPNIKVFGPPPRENKFELNRNWWKQMTRKGKINKIFNVGEENK